MNKNLANYIIVIGLIVLAGLSRLIIHPWNYTPVIAMALFGAAYLPNRALAYIVPLAAIWLSDLFLTNVVHSAYVDGFQWFSSFQWFTFSSYALIVLMGSSLLKKITASRVLGGALLSSILFFIISNLGAWITMPAIYPGNATGLLAAYVAGLPFFKYTFISALVFSGVFFGVYEVIFKRSLKLAPANT